MAYRNTRNDFITNAAAYSFTVFGIAACGAAAAVAVDAPVVAVTAGSVAFVAFAFLSLVAWAAR